jgi:hypothetical protein
VCGYVLFIVFCIVLAQFCGSSSVWNFGFCMVSFSLNDITSILPF